METGGGGLLNQPYLRIQHQAPLTNMIFFFLNRNMPKTLEYILQLRLLLLELCSFRGLCFLIPHQGFALDPRGGGVCSRQPPSLLLRHPALKLDPPLDLALVRKAHLQAGGNKVNLINRNLDDVKVNTVNILL